MPQNAIKVVQCYMKQLLHCRTCHEAAVLPQQLQPWHCSAVCMNNRCGWCLQDRINSLALSGPYTLSANDLLCSMLWHASCLVRNRTNTTGIFHMMFDLRQMHAPDDYFGNAHRVLSVLGEEPCVWSNGAFRSLSWCNCILCASHSCC